jgi:hypothetical protein
MLTGPATATDANNATLKARKPLDNLIAALLEMYGSAMLRPRRERAQ